MQLPFLARLFLEFFQYQFCSLGGGGMWIPAEQLGPLLKHHWFTTNCTESSLNYTLYNNRSEVKVYTLQFNFENDCRNTLQSSVVPEVDKAAGGQKSMDTMILRDKCSNV